MDKFIWKPGFYFRLLCFSAADVMKSKFIFAPALPLFLPLSLQLFLHQHKFSMHIFAVDKRKTMNDQLTYAFVVNMHQTNSARLLQLVIFLFLPFTRIENFSFFYRKRFFFFSTFFQSLLELVCWVGVLLLFRIFFSICSTKNKRNILIWIGMECAWRHPVKHTFTVPLLRPGQN